MIEVVRAAVEQWPQVKRTRLQALAEAPYAFGSTLARELAFPDEEWQRRVGQGDWFLAQEQEQVVGLAAAITEDAWPRERQLVGMWVHPDLRGTAVAASIVTAVCRWAVADGADAIGLWVADGNLRARRFYVRLGFQPTGERQPLPSNLEVGEERLLLALPLS